MSDEPIRLLLVDDHVSSREPLSQLLNRHRDLVVVGEAATLREARDLLASNLAIDVALIDLQLPDGGGTELIRALRHSGSGAKAIVLTGSADPLDRARAVDAGAAYVLHKSVRINEIVEAVRRLWAGEALLAPEEVATLVRQAREEEMGQRRAAATFAQLTPREREIVLLLAKGLSDREIAGRLFVAEKTVRNHMSTLISKLEVDSRLQVVVVAAKHGIVTLE